jgi:hypothetical protein
VITALSEKQKQLRMKMITEKDPDKLQQMRKERKRVLKEVVKEVKQTREREIDEICEEIEKTKDDARMFKAARKIQRKPFENPVVHDKEGKGKCVTEPQTVQSDKRSFPKAVLQRRPRRCAKIHRATSTTQQTDINNRSM